jgi:hypothetical protein
MGKKIYNHTIFEFEELLEILLAFNDGFEVPDVIKTFDFSVVSTKTKRFINRLRKYVNEK